MLKTSLRALQLPGRTFLRSSVRSLSAEVASMGDSEGGGAKFTQELSGEYRPDYPWKRVKKCACMLSFSGKNYHGMQRNFDSATGGMVPTIEGELLAALSKAGIIDPEWETKPQKAFFTRASRTDKGVSAARMVVSLKVLQEEKIVDMVNEHLPSDIRLQAVVRVGKNFNCQNLADARTYLYLLPTFAFSPVTDIVTENWRCAEDTIDKVNEIFKNFHGVHYFHNYTSGKLPMEPSSQRYIMEFEAGKPFEKFGLEWSVIRVKGQSFMLHQIRKMIGLGVAIARGHTGLHTLNTAWGVNRIDIPRAPGLGLLLDTVHYEKYNKRIAGDGIHEGLDWVKQADAVEKFKDEFIFSDIMETEMEEKSMISWLADSLPLHTWTPRHFESEDKEPSQMRKAFLKANKYADKEETAGDVETADPDPEQPE